MGITKLDWVDIVAWVSLTETQLSPDDAKLLMLASKTYVYWQSKVKGHDCPAPFSEEE